MDMRLPDKQLTNSTPFKESLNRERGGPLQFPKNILTRYVTYSEVSTGLDVTWKSRIRILEKSKFTDNKWATYEAHRVGRNRSESGQSFRRCRYSVLSISLRKMQSLTPFVLTWTSCISTNNRILEKQLILHNTQYLHLVGAIRKNTFSTSTAVPLHTVGAS
jgi:hypothetical protein